MKGRTSHLWQGACGWVVVVESDNIYVGRMGDACIGEKRCHVRRRKGYARKGYALKGLRGDAVLWYRCVARRKPGHAMNCRNATVCAKAPRYM